jgi:signal transduction histidine kinase
MTDMVKTHPVSTFDALEQAALLLGQGEDDGVLFHVVLTGIAQSAGAKRVDLLALGPGQGELREVANVGAAATNGQGDLWSQQPPIVQEALKRGEAQLAQSPDGSPQALALPLQSGGRAIGLIYAGQLTLAVVQEDLPRLQALANQAAAALVRADLVASLQAAEQARRDFVSLTTHEIRVPLTSISGYTDLILSGIAGPISERQEQFMRTVRRNVDRMTILINDLGDLNRIQDGRMPLDLAEFDMKALIDLVLETQGDAIAGRGHDLSTQLPQGLPLAFGDRPAIKRILEKILNNAILYTPEGGSIIVGAVQLGDRLEVTVADNGIGISREDRPRLFEPFFRSEAESVREHTGWGLSLALAKALLETQNGQLRCESELGAGAVFHITLPVAGTEPA